ncbi:MAG: hypothetical protein M9907_08655 [Burkholderiaceae bacterium]|nr:hypothetical protein [Burkholderiaceae bacterium]
MTAATVSAPSESPELAALRAAKARFDAAQAEVDRVLAAKPTPPDLSAVLVALADAQRDFEDASAARVLGTATDDEVRQAAEVLAKARKAHEAAAVKAEQFAMLEAGFTRALAQVQAEVDAAAEARREAENAWLRAELVDADERYCRAAETMFAQWRRAKSLHRALMTRGGRSTNYLDIAPPPTAPALAVWRSKKDHDDTLFRAQFVDLHAAELALQAASISAGEG